MFSNETKIFLGIIAATLVLVVGAALIFGGQPSQPSTSSKALVSSDILVRKDSWKIGSESAKVVLVEFSDFQCPSCKAAEPIVKDILGRYKDKILFVYRFFPLPSHEFGIDSAVAAQAAGKQGKFWEYKDKLFANQSDFQRDKLIGYAKDLGLNVDQFTKDIDADATRQRVLADQNDGNKAAVDATPTFFINGTKLVGFSDLDATIQSALK